jgi:hypothetical protein
MATLGQGRPKRLQQCPLVRRALRPIRRASRDQGSAPPFAFSWARKARGREIFMVESVEAEAAHHGAGARLEADDGFIRGPGKTRDKKRHAGRRRTNGAELAEGGSRPGHPLVVRRMIK